MIKETLRVRPVVPEVFRAPTGEHSWAATCSSRVHSWRSRSWSCSYDPALYPPDRRQFRPERFLDGAPEPYTWIPFGGGVRRCLGAAFAQLEMKVVISTILARARLRASRERSEKARFRGVTMLPSRGGEAVVERLRPERVAPRVEGENHPRRRAGAVHPRRRSRDGQRDGARGHRRVRRRAAPRQRHPGRAQGETRPSQGLASVTTGTST